MDGRWRCREETCGIQYAKTRRRKANSMASATIKLRPVPPAAALKDRVYRALRGAITSMDVYSGEEPPKLDERRLAEDLGCEPHSGPRGSLQARAGGPRKDRATKGCVRGPEDEGRDPGDHPRVGRAGEHGRPPRDRNAAADEIAQLRDYVVTFEGPDGARAQIDEYSDTNIRFHQAIIALSKSELLARMADPLFVHMSAIRAQTITERDRAARSIIDHMHIIEAIEKRDTELSERLVREHSFGLAEHVEHFVDYLE